MVRDKIIPFWHNEIKKRIISGINTSILIKLKMNIATWQL
jgi:hypothetical protein